MLKYNMGYSYRFSLSRHLKCSKSSGIGVGGENNSMKEVYQGFIEKERAVWNQETEIHYSMVTVQVNFVIFIQCKLLRFDWRRDG